MWSRIAARAPWTSRRARLGRLAPRRFVVAGGVAANERLRASLQDLAEARGFSFHAPPVALCGDNARDDRLGGRRTPRTWLDGPARCTGAAALAARPRRGSGYRCRREGMNGGSC